MEDKESPKTDSKSSDTDQADPENQSEIQFASEQPTKKFVDFDFCPEILDGVHQAGFEHPTPIQNLAFPVILQGKDLAGLAQTGTGKTAAFLLPLMDRVYRSIQKAKNQEIAEESMQSEGRLFADWRKRQFVLVLVPTRELAEQVTENVIHLRGNTGLRAVSIYGGVSYERQKEGLKEGVEFVVATPGRLIDLYKEHFVDLKQVRAIVFDEADRMFDMGFKDDMKFILQRVPKDRQFLVFSATLNLDVMNVAYQFGANPVEINVSRDEARAENVDDEIFHIGHDEKPAYLLSLIKKYQPKQAIIFSNFKMNVDRLARFLENNGVPALGISSMLSQAQRSRVMRQFQMEKEQNILVATDVAARGLDIKGVDLVINFELPDDPENYVHRIGRTGRAGQTGKAFSLVSDMDVDALGRIESYLKAKVQIGWMDDTELVKDYSPIPRDSDRPRRAPRDTKGSSPGPRRGAGPRPQGDRPQRSQGGRGRRGRDRNRDGDQQRDRQSARPRPSRQEGTEAGAARSGRETHRDYRLGRHRNQSQNRSGSTVEALTGNGDSSRRSERGGQQQTQQGNRRPNRRGGRRRNAQQRTQRQAPAAPAPQNLGQKVKGFFKKLFS